MNVCRKSVQSKSLYADRKMLVKGDNIQVNFLHHKREVTQSDHEGRVEQAQVCPVRVVHDPPVEAKTGMNEAV